mmetsp:Transcript_3289/g.4954  ORF Transcript_3289/g.4954 Transcript_3289/m.4954 type:complete len:428 (+) Transcript_3289:63-1346(+)
MLRSIAFTRSPSLQRFQRLSTTLRSVENAESIPKFTYATQAEQRPVAFWLLGMSGLIFGMVSVGGITRLTRSGLSMTDWKLQGSLPPLNTEQWIVEFERYKKFPEYQQRKSMTLEEFKFIYFWEYGHRMMGRVIGVAYAMPAAYFIHKGLIPRAMYPRIGLLFLMGGGQGLIGWWMVKSGLEKNKEEIASNKEIRVSPYRLATHLSMAFATYCLTLWTALDVLNPHQMAQKVASGLSQESLKFARKILFFGAVNASLVAVTVLSGAYVAGNDAGRAYNTFPTMNGEWIPSGLLEMKPMWRNFFENTTTVQFQHRVLALSTLASVTAMYVSTRMSQALWVSTPIYTRAVMHAVAVMSATQVGLGISTLLLYVPVPLAALHQAGSLTLLTLLTGLVHSLRFASPVALPLRRRIAAVFSTSLMKSTPGMK